MGKRVRRLGATVLLILLLTLVSAGVALWSASGSRVLATSRRADGSQVSIVGKPRLAGLLGIEIVQRTIAADGRVLGGYVKDQCGSWEEAERKYGDPTGGGLLPAE